MNELLTVNEAAAFLKMTPASMRSAIHRGQIAGVVRIGKRVRVKLADLKKSLGVA